MMMSFGVRSAFEIIGTCQSSIISCWDNGRALSFSSNRERATDQGANYNGGMIGM